MRTVLCGAYGTIAAALVDMTGARCVAIGSAAERGLPAEVNQVRMLSRARLPFADTCIDALAVDARTPSCCGCRTRGAGRWTRPRSVAPAGSSRSQGTGA
jgi:hypothetical protein